MHLTQYLANGKYKKNSSGKDDLQVGTTEWE